MYKTFIDALKLRQNEVSNNDVSNKQDATIFVYWSFYFTVYTAKSAQEDGRVCRPKHVEQIQIDQ